MEPRRFALIMSSRFVTVALIIYLFLSLPDYYKTWIDSYEDRNGYHDIYETTFTGKHSRFEVLLDENSDIAFFLLNSTTVIFIICAYCLFRSVHKLLEIDIVGILGFPAMFLFNPIDPVIRYLPDDWKLTIQGFYIVGLVLWFFYLPEIRRLDRINARKRIDLGEEY